MVREQEAELVEQEVERVYCDECGTECTDDHEIEPKEVCPSCAEDRTTFSTLKEAVKSAHMRSEEPDDEPSITLPAFVVMTALWPLVSLLMFISRWDGGDKPSTHNWRGFLLFTTGTAVWTAAITLLVMV